MAIPRLHKETSIFDESATISDGIDAASQTASSYITEITGGGVMVHPEGDSTSGWRIADAIELLKDGASHFKAWLVDGFAKLRVGAEDSGHVVLARGSMELHDGTTAFADEIVGVFSREGVRIGSEGGGNVVVSDDGIAVRDGEEAFFEVSRAGNSVHFTRAWGQGTMASGSWISPSGDVYAEPTSENWVYLDASAAALGPRIWLDLAGYTEEPYREWITIDEAIARGFVLLYGEEPTGDEYVYANLTEFETQDREQSQRLHFQLRNISDSPIDWKVGSGYYTGGMKMQAASPIPVSCGGTGASTAPNARAVLGAAASSHSHAIADVTGLQTALDGKAASSHSHAISDVTGLQAALDGKAPADISGLFTVQAVQLTASGSVGAGTSSSLQSMTLTPPTGRSTLLLAVPSALGNHWFWVWHWSVSGNTVSWRVHNGGSSAASVTPSAHCIWV